MAEPNAPPLNDDQVSRLADALDAWVDYHPFPDHPAFSFGETPASSFGQTGPFSPRQIAISVRERDELGATVVRMVQFATEVEPFESILARFYGEEVNA